MHDDRHLELRNGVLMPRLGLGTSTHAATAVEHGLRAGYRLVDTAFAYDNEVAVGEALRRAGTPREDVFITSKFNRDDHGRREVAAALERSLEQIGLDYLDLLLIHWPNPAQDAYVDAWLGMIDLLETGRVRAIGVSNFKVAHLERLIEATGVAPHVNQIELNPHVQRREVRAFHARHGIATQAWSPLGRGGDLLAEPVIQAIATKQGRTPAQVVLRWHLQSGVSAIPRSEDAGRQRENLGAFDFELGADDMESLVSLDRGESFAADSDVVGH
ncbi:MAG: oxidoreductase [Thermoleophilia bacterium]|nr:oxidoreductase [Thermoleophilia bacterium]